jgi:hypothetical protein
MSDENKPIIEASLDGENLMITIRPPPGSGVFQYSYLVVQIVRHIADCFKTTPGAVWTQVNQHRRKPQPQIRKPS